MYDTIPYRTIPYISYGMIRYDMYDLLGIIHIIVRIASSLFSALHILRILFIKRTMIG